MNVSISALPPFLEESVDSTLKVVSRPVPQGLLDLDLTRVREDAAVSTLALPLLKVGSIIDFQCTRPGVSSEKYAVNELIAIPVEKLQHWYVTRIVSVGENTMQVVDPFMSTVLQVNKATCRKIIDRLQRASSLVTVAPPPVFLDGSSLLPAPSPSPSPSPEPAASPVFEPISPQPPSPVSVVSLIRDFSARGFGSFSYPQLGGTKVYGVVSSVAQQVSDKERLLQIVNRYMGRFASTLEPFGYLPEFLGTVEECLFPQGAFVYVQADLHSDLISLMRLLSFWRQQGYLDMGYRLRNDFHVVLLGDYLDRGVNDIELLSLLLILRMENPTNVHLIRGNHEDVRMSAQYAPHADFLLQHEKELTDCFKTFPLAVLASSREGYIKQHGNCQHQYVHMSHGLFPVGSNSAYWLRGESGFIPVFKTPQITAAPPSCSEKTTHACRELFDKFKSSPEALDPEGYMWSDIGEISGVSTRGKGYSFSPEDMYLYRQASASLVSKVCAFIRGHQHRFCEYGGVKGKVIATTLPASHGTGFFEPELYHNGVQGVLYTVDRRVHNWKKTALLVEINSEHLPVFSLDDEEKSMYEPFCDEEGSVAGEEGESELLLRELSSLEDPSSLDLLSFGVAAPEGVWPLELCSIDLYDPIAEEGSGPFGDEPDEGVALDGVSFAPVILASETDR